MPQREKNKARSTWPDNTSPTKGNPWKKAELIRAAEILRKAQQKEEAWIRRNLSD